MNKKLLNYKKVTGGNKVALAVALVFVLASTMIVFLVEWNYWSIVCITIIAGIGYSYVPRKCPQCKRSMTYDFSAGFIPEAYYCVKDGVFIKSGVVNEGSDVDDWRDNNLIK